MEIALAAFTALAAIAAVVAACIALRALNAEKRRDQAVVLLTYNPKDGLVVVLNQGPKPAAGVALLAGAEGAKDFTLENIGFLSPGEDWRIPLIADRRFSIFLSWLDGRGEIQRREYVLDPHQPGVYGDGWPDLIYAIHQAKTYTQALKCLRQRGHWKVVEPAELIHETQTQVPGES